MESEIKNKLDKFVSDPEWHLVEDILMSYIDPLKSVSSIDTKLSNDQIASEVRGRQIAIDGLTKFLNDMKIVKGKPIISSTTFK